jgi:aminoglycoside/choline kinase family phosphotransferase
MLDTPRAPLIDAFLAQHLRAPYERSILAADASFRRYDRIICNNKACVLMDAPPPQEDVRPFTLMTHWLRSQALHAPELLAEDAEQGFLLLEDLGDLSFKKHIATAVQDEWRLYKAAIDVLLRLRDAEPLPAIASYDHATYRRELEVFTDWYLPEIGKEPLKADFLALWDELLNAHSLKQNNMVLRDYHAENLMWLPDADDHHKVGLLDYQDALIGDAAYDLVSLLKDARRDVSPETAERSFHYYIEQSGENAEDFACRYAILGAQRNLKIIGIFNRLARRDGKAHYLELLPRVWAHLNHDLTHPALADVQKWMAAL